VQRIQLQPQPQPVKKPLLLVDNVNPDRTVAALRDILADAGGLYDRGVPVRLVKDQMLNGVVASELTQDALIMYAHSVCRPYFLTKNGESPVRFPKPLAKMYLDWRGEWKLPPFNGIATAPLLHEDGSIHSLEGYDPHSGMWCERVPKLDGLLPQSPSFQQAEAALLLIRSTFRTFCFADAKMIRENGVDIVDLRQPPGKDESAFLVALSTAVCRPSLWRAPGFIFRAPQLSGAGSGKGKLARCICQIAFGRHPSAFTKGPDNEEFEKRIASELIEGNPVVFIDNLNNYVLKSDTLGSAITERPSRVRVFRVLKMVQLNAVAFIILTGNGLTVSEDNRAPLRHRQFRRARRRSRKPRV
jgi:hypothetical protein